MFQNWRLMVIKMLVFLLKLSDKQVQDNNYSVCTDVSDAAKFLRTKKNTFHNNASGKSAAPSEGIMKVKNSVDPCNDENQITR